MQCRTRFVPDRRPRRALMRALSIAVIALAPLCEAADPTTSQAPLEPTKAAKESTYQNQVVCTYRTPVGTRIARKTCMTRAQTDAEGANVKETMHEMAKQADRNAWFETGTKR